MKVTEEIIDKIRKCLRLANGLNATQAEMETAMGKAKEVALRYNIEIGSIDMKAGKEAGSSFTINKGSSTIRSQKEQQYHRWIYIVLYEVFGVSIIRSSPQVYFVGEAVDVAICQELFPWLENVFWSTFYKLAKQGVLQQYSSADRNGYYSGLCQGIIDTNKREEEKLTSQEKQCFAMVVRNKEVMIREKMAEEFPFLRHSRSRKVGINASARQMGFEKGKQIHLRQMGGTAPLALGK